VANSVSKDERRLRSILALNLRRLRSERNWSQEECAHQLGLHSTHLQKLEYGAVNATLRTVAKLCAGFGIAAHELMRSTD
jgi:transcriptional regulator with XRE-family HTH domain